MHIKKEIIKQVSIKSLKNPKIVVKDKTAEVKEAFNSWLKNIRISMHLCKYRQVINEIESKKYTFKSIPQEHWKYQCIEIDAIFKLLRKKFIHHTKEISKENTYQHHSCLFWLNQIFLLLEKLVLEFRPDLNSHLDYNKESIMKPIRCIIEGYYKFFFALIVFAQYNHQIHEICSYISIIDRLIPYIGYSTSSNSYIYLQRIHLLKVKLFIENCDYLNAMQTLEKNIYLCFDYIRLLGDEEFNIYYYNCNDEKYKKYYEDLNMRASIRSLLIKQNREKDLKASLKTPNKKYKKKDSNMNTPSPSKINSSINKFKFGDNNNILNTHGSKISVKNNSNKESTSNIEEKSNKNLIQIKIKNISIKNKILNESENKKDVFITQIQKTRTMNPKSKKVIEDILSNIALNFYLRATIFEHLGVIDSALDSYKEVDWFSMKFLTNKFPKFAKYISDLLKCAWNNYNLITTIKMEKEKRKNMRLLEGSIEEAKGKLKLKKNMFQNLPLNRFKYHKLKNNEQKLKKYLDNLGKQLYKEEEIRNANLFCNFTKTGYILSTVKMIDDLLSDNFKHVLKEMKKIEITKQKDEIKDLINKTILKNQKSNDEQSIIKSKLSSNTINILKRENNHKLNNIIINRNKNINNNLVLRKQQLITLRKPPNRNNYFHYIEPITKKYSISCRNSDKKKASTILNQKESDRKQFILDKLGIKDNSNISNIHDSVLRKKLFNFNKYSIGKPYSKINSRYPSSRSSHSKEKVEKYPIDKEFFNKDFIKKKFFLDKFCNKELKFQKNLLKTKSCDREFNKTPEDFNLKKVIHDAELNFNTIFEIAKSTRRKKNLNNLIKQNYNIINKNTINNTLKRPSSSFFNNNLNFNEIKLKELNLDYNKIISKRNELIKKKKILFME